MQLSTFYESAIQSCAEKIRSVRRKINIVSLLRLLLFAGFIATLYFLISGFSLPLAILTVVMAILFIGSVNFYFRLKDQLALWEKLSYINANESGLLAGRANGFPDGLNWLDPDKDIYVDDLDIFGSASLFHWLNRTTTSHGSAALATLLRDSLPDPDMIRQQQEAVKAFAGQADVRRLLAAKGLLSGDKAGDLHSLGGWLTTGSRLYHRKTLRIFLGALALYNAGAILFWLSGNNSAPLAGGVITAWLCTGFFSGYVSRQHEGVAHKQAILQQYADILAVFTTADAGSSSLLQQWKTSAATAHKAIRQLSRLASFFDQRGNLLVNLFMNSLMCYDLQCVIALERWKSRYKKDFPQWIDTVGSIECLNSLATFAFNNPGYVYPSPVAAGPSAPDRHSPSAAGNDLHLVTTGLAHPLIPPSRRVANDFSIGHSERLILVTGSNMSGKTTFLRTIGVNLLLAQCGAPVCATSFVFTPMRLLTSLRISDSLQEQTSYFMAELKKLQRIVLRLRTGEPALVLIDEILRGTNSEDKTYGSEQFARKLTGYHCLSLFATHDLTLGQLEQECPGVIANYCFESVIEGDDLHFNYRLQQGIARNRNASFLMKKMDII
jgi:hypothetical protein